MTGTLAQLIALVAYGNKCIADPGTHPAFVQHHSTFQFCGKVFFTAEKKKHFFSVGKRTTVAENPQEWFRYLGLDGCQALRLYYEPSDRSSGAADHKIAGMIGGGGTWLIEAMYPKYSDFWYGEWIVSREHAADNRIWSVEYRCIEQEIDSRNLQFSIGMQREVLSKVLSEIEAFAKEIDLENFSQVFQKANAALGSAHPNQDYYHSDLLPENAYGLAEQQLLFAASHAWVFGGMGSWNDMGFEDKQIQLRYETLSSALYTAINDAIIAVVNS
jgi:hypothetical protein